MIDGIGAGIWLLTVVENPSPLADPNEIWIMEMIGKGPGVRGAVWVAVRVPDDCISAHANQSRIHQFNMNDKENCMYSADVISFAREKGYFDGVNKDFSFCRCLCSARFWCPSLLRGPCMELFQYVYRPW